MKLSQSTVKLSLIVAIVLFVGLVVFYTWQDIASLVGVNLAPKSGTDSRGQSISFIADAKNLTIPPVYSEDIFNYIKKELTEKGGLPLNVGKKGNSLPFGIP